MPKELSAKDKEMKEMMEKALASPDVTWVGRGRQLFGLLPSDPRCTSCLSPFEGWGGTFARTVFNKKRSQTNPLFCTTCEDAAKRTHAGVEVEMSMLFADIRGSTPLAESMSASEFKGLIDRFYSETTHVLSHSFAIIDKLAGDEVSGFYLPGYLGKDYAKRSVEAAQEILQVTGHADPEGPWAPVGVGINTGEAYFGVVGQDDEMVEITALGDEVNVAARLASQAAAGEIVLSESTVRKAGLDVTDLEKRTLELKGKSQPIDVWVMIIERGSL
ncbi:MAG: adenylate/guanylate cyclase domain-containing protein [Anaerolineales bacterium]|jgi:adenylate cyclase